MSLLSSSSCGKELHSCYRCSGEDKTATKHSVNVVARLPSLPW